MIEQKKKVMRSDKKIDCKPTISVDLKECIYRLSYITNTPVKDVAEEICKKGLHSRKVVEYLSEHFRRELRLGNTYYMGDLNRPSLQRVKYSSPTSRITIRFQQHDFWNIKALAFALDCTPSKATAILLEASIRNTDFINQFTKKYIKAQLDEQRLKELQRVIRYLNKNSPYEEKISWASLLSFLYDELRLSTNNMTKTLNKWIDQMK